MIDAVVVTEEALTSQGGSSLLVRYLWGISLASHPSVGALRRRPKGRSVWEIDNIHGATMPCRGLAEQTARAPVAVVQQKGFSAARGRYRWERTQGRRHLRPPCTSPCP